ncbi:MAG: RNA polymerase sigma factor [Parasporobacterium sp.]|nr:RNA polymerase sigma factor [Parasporobacterium sp.]
MITSLQTEYEAVLRYALFLTKDRESASELTQETFLKAMNSIGSFRGDSSLLTWLCSIARNTWINDRKLAHRSVPVSETEDIPDDRKAAFDELIAQRDMAMKIHEVLHEMPDPYKEVFTLRIFGELSFKEIAALFGKSENWGNVTFFRAKKMIISKLIQRGII